MMARYITLLRAVNVGGTGKLPMSDLKSLCIEAGFTDVETYIASGNVVFTSRRSLKAQDPSREGGYRAELEYCDRVARACVGSLILGSRSQIRWPAASCSGRVGDGARSSLRSMAYVRVTHSGPAPRHAHCGAAVPDRAARIGILVRLASVSLNETARGSRGRERQ